MRRRYRALIVLLALGAAAALPVSVGLAAAQEPDPLDEIRALIPPGAPGEDDLVPGDGLYGQLAEAVGLSTDVADFGSGSQLTGPCGGFAFSYDNDGEILDAAFDAGDDNPPVDLLSGEQAFTSSNPFKVDSSGVVAYFGFMPLEGDGPEDHSWEIKTSGISLDTGGDPNNNFKNRNRGIVDLENDLPFKFSAKVKVEGLLTSQNLAPCFGQGHVEMIGPLFGPVGVAATALMLGGFMGLLFNSRPAYTWKA